jgi:hypothetical protein
MTTPHVSVERLGKMTPGTWKNVFLQQLQNASVTCLPENEPANVAQGSSPSTHHHRCREPCCSLVGAIGVVSSYCAVAQEGAVTPGLSDKTKCIRQD